MSKSQGFSTLAAVILLVVVAAAAAGITAYVLQVKVEPQPTTQTTNGTNRTTTNATNTATATQRTAAETHAAFQGAINTQRYELTEPLLAAQVQFVIEASECCGLITPAEVVTQLDYLESASVFDFSPDQQVVRSMQTNLPQFADDTIGVASTKHVIAYHLNASNAVDEIYLVVSHELLDLE